LLIPHVLQNNIRAGAGINSHTNHTRPMDNCNNNCKWYMSRDPKRRRMTLDVVVFVGDGVFVVVSPYLMFYLL
jgi:hypothetical protein